MAPTGWKPSRECPYSMSKQASRKPFRWDLNSLLSAAGPTGRAIARDDGLCPVVIESVVFEITGYPRYCAAKGCRSHSEYDTIRAFRDHSETGCCRIAASDLAQHRHCRCAHLIAVDDHEIYLIGGCGQSPGVGRQVETECSWRKVIHRE